MSSRLANLRGRRSGRGMSAIFRARAVTRTVTPSARSAEKIVVLTRGEVVVTEQDWQSHRDSGLVQLALDP